MSKTIEVIYYETPRHGYLQVKGEDLRDLKISQSFTHYSYYDEDNDIFYLEEDSDASMFAKRCELDGVEIKEETEHLDSEEEDEKIKSLLSAGGGGDWGYFGELEQNITGLKKFFRDKDNEED
jgi:hypothetical protein